MNVSVFCFLMLSAVLSQKYVHAFTEEEKQLIKNLHEKCTAETGATDVMIENAQKGTFVEDEKLKCYLKCVWVTMTVMDEDGEVDEGVLQVLLPPEIKDDFLTSYGKCKGATGSNTCDKAYAMSKCIQEANPSAFFLP